MCAHPYKREASHPLKQNANAQVCLISLLPLPQRKRNSLKQPITWVIAKEQNESVVRFIDNGIDRTEEAYKINNIEIVPEEENEDLIIPTVPLPLPHEPLAPQKEEDEGFDREEVNQIQSRLWNAVFSTLPSPHP